MTDTASPAATGSGTPSPARTAPTDPDALLRIAAAEAALGVDGVHRLGAPAGRALASARAATVGGSAVSGVRLLEQDGRRTLQVTIVAEYPRNVVEVADAVRRRVAQVGSQAAVDAVDVVVADVHGPFDRPEDAQDPQDVQPRDGAVQRAGDAAGQAARAASAKASEARASAARGAADVKAGAQARAEDAKVAASKAAETAGAKAADAKAALAAAVDDAGTKAAAAKSAAAKAVDAAAAAADASSRSTAAAVAAAEPADPAPAADPVVVVVAEPSAPVVVGTPDGPEPTVVVVDDAAVVAAPVVDAPVVDAPVVDAPVVAAPVVAAPVDTATEAAAAQRGESKD